MSNELKIMELLVKQPKYKLEVVEGFSIEIHSNPPNKFHRWMLSKMLGFKFILPDENGDFNSSEDDQQCK